jgi:hypothetical protein
MAFAQLGSGTTAMEAVATAIGAGMIIGGFLASVAGLVLRKTRQTLERWSLEAGYAGGGFGALLLLIESLIRYGG